MGRNSLAYKRWWRNVVSFNGHFNTEPYRRVVYRQQHRICDWMAWNNLPDNRRRINLDSAAEQHNTRSPRCFFYQPYDRSGSRRWWDNNSHSKRWNILERTLKGANTFRDSDAPWHYGSPFNVTKEERATSHNSTHYDVHSFGKAMLKHSLAQSIEFTPPRLVRVGCFARSIAPNGAA